MALTLSHVIALMVTQETTVKQTSTNVHQSSVRMVEHATIISTPTCVNVKRDMMETPVKTISMNATTIHVKMVECAKMVLIHTHVNA